MPNGHIVDLTVHRLRLQLTAMGGSAAPPRQIPTSFISPDLPIPDDETALVAALVIRLTARFGRSHDSLPPSVSTALMDLVIAGDPVARLLYAWIDQASTDNDGPLPFRQPPDRHHLHDAKQSIFGTRIYRHGRSWRAGSMSLVEADRRRLGRLQALLAQEINHGN